MVPLNKITKNGRALFLAYDQGLEHGPSDFNDHNFNPDYIFTLGVTGKFTAVITHKGIAEKYYPNYRYKIPLIIKLNGKTALGKGPAFSPLVCDVNEAISLGASAVGYTIYLGSPLEAEMFSTFGSIVHQAHSYNIPAIGWMYPRAETIDENDPATIAYAARVGMELGADIVKIKYPGSSEALTWAIKNAGKTKVVVSGGSKMAVEDLIEEAKRVMRAEAFGFAIGRNIWQQEHPLEVAAKLHRIVI